MPKILRILNRFNIGGPIYNAAYLSRYLSPKYETLLLGGTIETSEKDALYILDQLDVNYETIPYMGRKVQPANDRKALQFIENKIKEFKPDIVHTHASKAGALGRIAAHRQGVKVIVHTFHGHVFHSYFAPWKSAIYKMVERSLAKKSSAIIAISPSQKDELVNIHKITNNHKMHVIPLGFDLDRFQTDQAKKRLSFRQKYNLDEDTIAIGTVGRLVPIKNHNLFLSAIHHLEGKTTNKWKAFIIGDGESRQAIEQKATELNIKHTKDNNPDSRLYFTSFISEMDEVMAGLDIVVLSSLNEGTPVSLIEAQAAGKPILSTNVGGVQNVITEGVTALTTSPKDVMGFHNLLVQLTNEEKLRKKLGDAGPESVAKKYHYQRLIKDMDKLYTQLLTESV